MKETIQLPQTDFPMKANLPEREPVMIAKWEKDQIYQKLMAKNKGRKIFTMPDGPPYANGSLHTGHVLNKCLKDFTVKYRNMAGFAATFIPGWDCHGLPIEMNVTKALGPKRKEKTDTEIRALCRAEANKWVAHQGEQFRRLGVMADWKNPYLTMAPDYEAEEVRVLARALRKGTLYRGEKPVYWCPTLQTALAEAEVEYHEHKSPSIYFVMDFTKGAEKFGKFAKPVGFAVWTTTPWTLPANLGVALNADFDYGFFDAGDRILILANGLKEAVESHTGLTLTPTGTVAKGSAFEKMNARHPFYDRDSLIVLGSHVTMEAGTGAVHTAPGHGQDDYRVGLQYGLKVLSPIDAAGKYTDEVPEYVGIKIWDANPLVVQRLRDNKSLLSFTEFVHQYPHNWRSKTPLIFRATPQWFLGMDLVEGTKDDSGRVVSKDAAQMRARALKEIENIKFVPAWGEARLRAMIENRPDWCLSRQRIWGVPIPVFECTACKNVMADADVMDRVADAIEKEGGIEAYYAHAESDFMKTKDGKSLACAKCSGTEFSRGKDILDVWFDSGVAWSAVQKRREGMEYPADIYLEGSDQHRGWFQTSLLASMATEGKAPFKALVTHAFVNDAQGRKMSKSLGNALDPVEMTKKSGAEILRLWCSFVDFAQDMAAGQESFDRVTETYRRFRNTMRFFLGNISDFDPAKDSVTFDKMTVLDQWALGRLNDLVTEAQAGYDGYEFYKVYHALTQYFTVALSAGYLDMLKDRLYTFKKDGVERRSAQTAVYTIAETLTRVMAPITSFLAEEVYGYLPGPKAESVFLTEYPKTNASWVNETLKTEVSELFTVRSDVTKKLEELRQLKTIGSGLDAKVTIIGEGPKFELLKKYEPLLMEFFIVSQVSLKVGPWTDKSVHADHADGAKCERCWYWSTEIGKDKKYPTVCPKCSKALS
ncbi:isoleucine--tRNA ligase [soil metagenome]